MGRHRAFLSEGKYSQSGRVLMNPEDSLLGEDCRKQSQKYKDIFPKMQSSPHSDFLTLR
jgi:hypothetical protein